MGAMSSNFNDTPDKASRAYDTARDGFVTYIVTAAQGAIGPEADPEQLDVDPVDDQDVVALGVVGDSFGVGAAEQRGPDLGPGAVVGGSEDPVVSRSGEVLGGSIVGSHAAELISVIALAVAANLRVSDIVESLLVHPALSEALAEAAE